MTRRAFASLCLMASAVLASQTPRKRISPHETVSIDLGGKTISITYGRPSLKGRTVGNQVAPFGQVWRLGADEATKLTTAGSLSLGGQVDLAPGSYSLFAVPGENKWTVIVNKVADQWGAFKYDQSQDLGRFDVPVEKTAAPVEEFTIALEAQGGKTAKLNFSWGGQSVSTTLEAR